MKQYEGRREIWIVDAPGRQKLLAVEPTVRDEMVRWWDGSRSRDIDVAAWLREDTDGGELRWRDKDGRLWKMRRATSVSQLVRGKYIFGGWINAGSITELIRGIYATAGDGYGIDE